MSKKENQKRRLQQNIEQKKKKTGKEIPVETTVAKKSRRVLSTEKKPKKQTLGIEAQSTDGTDISDNSDISDINLSAYAETYSRPSEAHFNPLVPANSQSGLGRFSTLSVDRLPQTHVLYVIKGEFNNRYKSRSPFKKFPIEKVIQNLESYVVALSSQKGEAFGSGFIISPKLVIVPHHCLENRALNQLYVRAHYQLDECGMNLRETLAIAGVVEEDANLDYAIIQLEKPIPDFTPVNLKLSGPYHGPHAFIHHPGGGPKQVSVHATSEPSRGASIAFASFHDTEKGSSGGIYTQTPDTISAMHLMNQSGTYGVLMSTLYRASPILKQLYNTTGKPTHLPTPKLAAPLQLRVRPAPEALARSRQDAQETIETKPLHWKAIKTAHRTDLAHHHIIPKGDMEFLWIMSKEYPKLDSLLKTLAFFHQSNIKNKNGEPVDNPNFLMAKDFIWAPWNLFIGPDGKDRPHEKKNPNRDPGSDGVEPVKPAKFNSNLWRRLNQLHGLIQDCWETRRRLDGFHQGDADAYSKNRTAHFDQAELDGEDNVDNIARFLHPVSNREARRNQLLKNYKKTMDAVFISLSQIKPLISSKKTQESIHGWDMIISFTNGRKIPLKGSNLTEEEFQEKLNEYWTTDSKGRYCVRSNALSPTRRHAAASSHNPARSGNGGSNRDDSGPATRNVNTGFSMSSTCSSGGGGNYVDYEDFSMSPANKFEGGAGKNDGKRSATSGRSLLPTTSLFHNLNPHNQKDESEQFMDSLYTSYPKLGTFLKEVRVDPEGVLGDGNCFFESIARLLGNGATHTTVRAEAISYFKKNPSLHQMVSKDNDIHTVEQYSEKMAQNKEYATMPIIQATANLYDISLLIVDYHNDTPIEPITLSETNTHKFILLLTSNLDGTFPHYTPLRLQPGVTLKDVLDTIQDVSVTATSAASAHP